MKLNKYKFATLSILIALTTSALAQTARLTDAKSPAEVQWSELTESMDDMRTATTSLQPAGDTDVDFVKLMLPHHQAAIDMAKVELSYGKDPQIRRLAQEIIIDQQSEIDVMRLWLKQHEGPSQK